ncbi:hypothetical protein OBRU01_25776 [Operophtera brumata]|uniref:G-patch domain-containing protein n=1 Tax=Operophtera brumata TaxID=104452 RepID=A0A0L7K3X3_OPEBR|nr:hypothetical protein OBRU01_25776 [Operophtera brumata]
MLKKHYNNFVKASAPTETVNKLPTLSGEEAKEIYLKEIKDAKYSTNKHHLPPRDYNSTYNLPERTTSQTAQKLEDISIKGLILSVQNNDVKMLKDILDSCPSLVNTVDEFGWSLLMIACQANSVDAVKELLTRGVDTAVRDKGGNSATNLVIKNKNLELADLLISHRKGNHRSSNSQDHRGKIKVKKVKAELKESFICEICSNKVFPDKEEHLASTVHNISASKDKKIPTNYVIPQTNRGYQLMLKVGWDRECGLGRDGSGKKYPIKAVQKKDRKGLGHEKKKTEKSSNEVETRKNSKLVMPDLQD